MWFDKWEIKVGESIIERIDNALNEMTYLVIFLSKISIDKPWLKKEFPVVLFRKLEDSFVKIIPVLIDKVEVPTIIKDIKYADCSKNKVKSFEETIEALTKS